MQVIMYAEKFSDREIIRNNIKLGTIRFEEFENRLSNGEKIFCIDSNGMVDALARSQGVLSGYLGSEGNRSLTEVTFIEYTNPKIPEAAIVCLLDIISFLLYFRFQTLNSEFNYQNRASRIIEEKISHISYPKDPDEKQLQIISQGLELLQNDRFVLSLLRFSNAIRRTDFKDVVLDCSSSIEALFSFSKELTLRYTLAAYHIDVLEPSYTSMIVKKMYKVRSSIIHGKDTDEINDSHFIGDVLTATHYLLLSTIVRNKIFTDDQIIDEILNHYKGLEHEG